MVSVQRIKIEPITEESFAPYGALWDAEETPSDLHINSGREFDIDGKTTVGVIWQPYETLRFNELERHFGVAQSFIQLSGSPAVVAASVPTDPDDPMDVPDPKDVRAFLIDPNKGFSFKRGTWHSLNRHILAPPGATFIILNSSPNPTQFVNYETSTGLNHADLGVGQDPSPIDYKGRFGIDYKGRFGVIFEFAL